MLIENVFILRVSWKTGMMYLGLKHNKLGEKIFLFSISVSVERYYDVYACLFSLLTASLHRSKD